MINFKSTLHNSVEVLQLPTVNLDACGPIRNAFGAREAFNVHPTTHHGEQEPFVVREENIVLVVFVRLHRVSRGNWL